MHHPPDLVEADAPEPGEIIHEQPGLADLGRSPVVLEERPCAAGADEGAGEQARFGVEHVAVRRDRDIGHHRLPGGRVSERGAAFAATKRFRGPFGKKRERTPASAKLHVSVIELVLVGKSVEATTSGPGHSQPSRSGPAWHAPSTCSGSTHWYSNLPFRDREQAAGVRPVGLERGERGVPREGSWEGHQPGIDEEAKMLRLPAVKQGRRRRSQPVTAQLAARRPARRMESSPGSGSMAGESTPGRKHAPPERRCAHRLLRGRALGRYCVKRRLSRSHARPV